MRICVEIYSNTLRRRNQEQNRFFYKCYKNVLARCEMRGRVSSVGCIHECTAPPRVASVGCIHECTAPSPCVILSEECTHDRVEVLRNGVGVQRNAAKPQVRNARSGICVEFFQCLLSLGYIFEAISYRLRSNVTLCKQAC